MSSDETQAALARAHELVESGQLDEARAIVEPILAADQDNADAWWIYAHAVTDPEEGRTALENVLRLDPNYPGAADLMALADEEAPAQPPPAMPEHLPEPNFPSPDADEEPAPATPVRSQAVSRGLPIVPIIAVVIIVALVLLVLLSQSGGSVSPTPTPTEAVAIISAPTQSIAQAATLAVTEEPTVTALPANVTQAAGSTESAATPDFTVISTALSQFTLPPNGITEAATSLGNTLLVSVCSTAGREMRTLLPQAMDALAQQSASLASSVQAIGVSMVNCDQNNAPLLTVAVDIASAQSYASGALTDSAFAALWKPQ